MLTSSIRYDTSADVQLRLQNSVVRYEDRPVFVGQGLQRYQDNANDLTLDVFDLLSQKWIEEPVHSSDQRLEVKAMPLGYMNTPACAYYVMRQPCRRARQGLTIENCYTYDLDSGKTGRIAQHYLKSLSFGRMVVGEYPTLSEALYHLKLKGVKSQAIGRKVCVRVDEMGLVKLVYFTVTVGVYSHSKQAFIIPERFEHYLPVVTSYDVPCCLED